MTPWKLLWHYHGAATPSCPKITFFDPRGPMLFAGAWRPPNNAMPSNFQSAKSWVSELSLDVSFVSLILKVLSEYWKRLEENFRKNIISTIFKKWWNLKKVSSSLFQYSERTISSTETNDTSAKSSWSQLFKDRKFEGFALSGGRHALSPQKA